MISRFEGTRAPAALLLAIIGTIGAAQPGQAQTLEQRLSGVNGGTVRLSFAAREGVCGNGRNISMNDDDDEWNWGCEPGPVRVALTFSGRTVTRVKTYVGGRWRPRPDTQDWGDVSAPEAARYFLAFARRSDNHAAEEAILPAALADSITIWPDLLRMAKDQGIRLDTRRQAVFWLSQAAGEAAAGGLDSLVYQNDLDRSVREQAVFALSQLSGEKGVPILLRVARTHKDPEIRRKAIFWLGQSEDPRALALFEELLLK